MSSASLGAMAAAGVLLTACAPTPSPSRPGPVDESVLRTTGPSSSRTSITPGWARPIATMRWTIEAVEMRH